MEEEKAAAYYDELTRKGSGAAKFKQGLGFSSTSNNDSSTVPSRGSALVSPLSSSSFLSSFVRASSPSKTNEFEKQAQLQSIQNKLKKTKKPDRNYDNAPSSSSSKGKSSSRSRSPSRERHSRRTSKRQSRSRSRGKERHSRHRSRGRSRSRSRSRDDYRSKRRYRSRSRSRSRSRDRDRENEKKSRSRRRSRSASPRDRRSKVGKDRASTVDYGKLIEGYEKMTPAERVKAKIKLQLSETATPSYNPNTKTWKSLQFISQCEYEYNWPIESFCFLLTARKDITKGTGSGWERFDFDKDAPLDDEEIEAAEDDAALVNHIGKSFRFSAIETRREEQIKAAHDEAIFGAPSLLPLPPSTETDDEAEDDDGKEDTSENATLISGLALAMQQGSWRDRARR